MSESFIIAEKPQAARRIEAVTKVKTLPAVGHLLELKKKNFRWTPPYFDLDWVPRKSTTKNLDPIIQLAQEASKTYIATDYDTEGQLIALNILRYAKIQPQNVLRMKFSSLEKDELLKSFNNPVSFDVNLALSAETRHYLDWYFGNNISKALTIICREMQSLPWRGLTPVGRVQSPTLDFLVQKEETMSKFIGKDLWYIDVYGLYDKNRSFEITTLSLDTEEGMEDFVSYGRTGTIQDFYEHTYKIRNYPPNKDDIMKKCLNLHLSPSIVNLVLQDLYLNEYISYPRTSSQKYSSHAVDTQKYLKNLISVISLAKDALGNTPSEGTEDDIHPAIYPIKPYVGKDLRGLVWNLIAEAFVKSHLPPEEHKYESCEVKIFDRTFVTREIPQGLEDGSEFAVVCSEIHKGKTAPPNRHKISDLYNWMLKQSIGTKDTRSTIISRLLKTYLYETKKGLYVDGKGMNVAKVLSHFCPELVDVNLTRKFESYVEEVRNGMQKEKILAEGRKEVTEMVEKLFQNKDEILKMMTS